MKEGVSLREIAEAAGVSTMTVSRALRNYPKVSADVRARILRIAGEMGYQPNPRLAKLMLEMRMTRMRGEAPVLAAVHTFYSDEILQPEHGPHMYCYLNGIRRRAEALGFRVDIFSLGQPPMKPARLQQILLTRNVDGLILFPFPYERKSLDLDYSQFPVAALGRSQLNQNFHRASPNYYHAVEVAFGKVLAAGYQRIGALFSDAIDVRAGGRYSAAFLQLQERHRELAHIPLLRLAELKKRPINAWIRKHRPDVILGMGPKTLDVLNRFGYQVPQDFSYVGLELPFRDTNIAGIHCNHELVAEAAVDLVINQINANERGLAEFPKTVTIDGYWQDGSTMPGKEL